MDYIADPLKFVHSLIVCVSICPVLPVTNRNGLGIGIFIINFIVFALKLRY